MQSAPISCIIISYNNERTIEAAILSVIRQSLPVAEIIVSDDGSADGTVQIIEKLAGMYPSIRPILRPTNIGVSANRDLSVRSASQPFITVLDGDDLYAPHKIRSEWQGLKEDHNTVVFSRVARISPGHPFSSWVRNCEKAVSGPPIEVSINMLLRKSSIPRDMLLSKSLYERAGGFDHDLSLYEDWLFKLRIASLGPTWKPSGSLGTLYFKRVGSLSTANQDELAQASEIVKARFREFLATRDPGLLAFNVDDFDAVMQDPPLNNSNTRERIQGKFNLLRDLPMIAQCLWLRKRIV